MKQRIMGMYFILVTSILLVAGSSSPDLDISIPPSILPTSTPSHLMYRSDHHVVLPCQATGSPQPRYIWYLNGELLNLNWRRHLKATPDTTNGTLTIKRMTSLDEGYYQCQARNLYGTSLSKVFYLQRASLGMYPPRSIQSYTVKEGMPLRMTCIDLKSIPKPTYSWALAQSKRDWAPVPLITTPRIVLDADGNLYFTHVMKDDEQLVFGESRPSLLYKCNVLNRYFDMMTAGSYSRIIVETGDDLDKTPTPLFVTPSPHYVVKGEKVRIQCIFAGKPTVVVTWERTPGGRGKTDQSMTVLEISQVRNEDAGTYTCRGHNAAGNESESIQVVVQSKPEFVQQPSNINATEGETVSFECRSTIDTQPPADINWYINGEPLDPVAPGPRTEISDGGHRLTIRNVCKDCPSGTSDLKVIQCNASNVHGYAFAEGYLNVLLATVISTAPEDLTINTDSSLAVFHCEAHSDPSTPVSYLWTRDERQLSYYQDERMETNESTSGITLTINLHDVTLGDKRKYEGVYKCIASNQYSTAEGSATLMIDDGSVEQTNSLILLCMLEPPRGRCKRDNQEGLTKKPSIK